MNTSFALALTEYMDHSRLTAERLEELIEEARREKLEDILSALLELKVRRGLGS